MGNSVSDVCDCVAHVAVCAVIVDVDTEGNIIAILAASAEGHNSFECSCGKEEMGKLCY